MDELMICVAPCPGENQVEKFPGKMNVADEVIRSCNAGASIAHLHVRDEDGLQTTDPQWFQKDIQKIQTACSVIIEGSTGGTPEHTLAERCAAFTVPGIEMGSLNLGSINMAGSVYNNSMPDMKLYAGELKKHGLKPFLMTFDLSMLYNGMRLEEAGLIAPPYVYNFVFDIPDTLPFALKSLEIFRDHLPENSQWFLTRHHALGAKDFHAAIERGGHVRVGYEDGPFLSSGERARSNADLVEEVVEAARSLGRNIATPERAREMLGMN